MSATPAAKRAATRVSDLTAPPAPRFAVAWAALVYVLCSLTLAYPIVAGKFLVNPLSDEYLAGYAFREFGASMLHQTGSVPLWNPYLFGGLPFVGAMHGDIFYPPAMLLRWLFATDVAMSLAFTVHLVLAGLFTYLFLRRCGLSYFAALLGGVAYMLSGGIAGLASPGHDGKLYVSAMLPLVLTCLVAGIRDGKAWAWGPLAIAVGFAVLSPHPQLLQYMLLTSGAFALYLAFGPLHGERLERRVAWQRLGLAFAAVVVGAMIGAIQYLPVREYTAWSPRAGGREYDFATSYSLPVEEMLNFVLPQFSGILRAYWGRNNIHLHSDYLGVVALMLAGAAFVRGSQKERSFLWFWLGALVVSLLWSLGGETPFYHLVYAIVPGTKYFRAPSTMLFVVSFCTAVLAGLGAERVLSGDVGRRYAAGWIGFGAVLVLLAAGGALTNVALVIGGPQRAPIIEANAPAVVGGGLRSFAFILLAAVLLLAVDRRAIRPLVAGAALIALTALDLWTIERRYWMFDAPASVLYATDPTIDYIKQQPQPGRVMSLPLPGGPDPALHDPTLSINPDGSGDGFMVHRIRSLLGYQGNAPARYYELMDHENDNRRVLDPAIWRLLNVRYLLTNVDVAVSADSGLRKYFAGFTKLVGPAKSAAGSTIFLYRVPGDNPMAWVAPAIVKVADGQTLATVIDPRFDPRRVAIFDSAAKVPAASLTTLPDTLPIHVAVQHYEPGSIDLELDHPAPTGSALVVSENYYPGWSALVDGTAVSVSRADYVLMGVPLPAGARRVHLHFSSEAYTRGRAVTLLALGIAVLATIGGGVLERRRRG